MKKLLLAAALAFAPAAATAQAAPAAAPLPDADPALWVVRDDDTTIYLFGTFHLLDGRPWFNDEVRTAFDASNELVLEVKLPEDPAQIQQIYLRYARGPEGRTLSQRLPADLNEKLRQELTEIGIPPAGMEPLDPWAVANILTLVSMQRLGLSGQQGAEAVLTAAARERNIPIGEVETTEQQLQMFDNMPEAAQVVQLRETIEQLDEIQSLLQPMLASWSTGDIDALARIMNEGAAESPELFRILLTDRNARWSEWIQQRLARPGTVFMAVGAGHLGGRGSVQDYLAQRGLHAARVPHVEAPAS
jgi:uncharacterized protein YbaP (TraB family)